MQTTAQGFKYVEPADAIADFPTPDQSNWKLVEARTPRRVTSAQMTALTGLVDGQEIELEVDATLGIYWRLRYRSASASANKWEFVGGADLYSEVVAQESPGAVTPGYVALTTAGPSVTVPRAGDYLVGIGANCWSDHNAFPSYGFMSYDVGATGAVDADAIAPQAAARYCPGANLYRERVKAIPAANTALVAKYRQFGPSYYWQFAARFMRVRPIRVS